jgi:hypothetical protein
MSKEMEFKSKRSYGRLTFILVFTFILCWFVFDMNIYYSLSISFVIVILLLFTDNDLIIDLNMIQIKYPYNFLMDDINISWDKLTKVDVVYRSGLTHGSKNPSFIVFISNKSVKEFNYRLDREELLTVRRIVRSKNVEFDCKFCPYLDIDEVE